MVGTTRVFAALLLCLQVQTAILDIYIFDCSVFDLLMAAVARNSFCIYRLSKGFTQFQIQIQQEFEHLHLLFRHSTHDGRVVIHETCQCQAQLVLIALLHKFLTCQSWMQSVLRLTSVKFLQLCVVQANILLVESL